MQRFIEIFKLGMILLFILGTSQNAFAKRKGGQLVQSINEAVERSDTDQERIKDQIDREADHRVQTWADRDRELIEIKHTGVAPTDTANLGEADLTYEEVGIDQSGLDSLRTDVEEEPIHIDFDKELRDVSSVKD